MANVQEVPTTLSIESALRIIASDGIYVSATIPHIPRPIPEAIANLTPDEFKAALEFCMPQILELGQHLMMLENLDSPPQTTPISETDMNMSIEGCLASIEPLRIHDAPLFHMLRDSLGGHTPIQIICRWNAMKASLQGHGYTLTSLLTEAERTPRRRWTALCLTLYHLLLDHNEALLRYTNDIPAIRSSSLSCHASAICIALRIRLYLPRVSQAFPPWRCIAHKCFSHRRYRKYGRFVVQIRVVSVLVYQEIHRLRNSMDSLFDNVKRELASEAIEVDTIAARLSGVEDVFCTICQDSHTRSECVSPSNCSCIFGDGCLKTLLNRDSESSYTCPNCRAQLHEPLQWRVVIESMDDEVLELGLLGAHCMSISELAAEVTVLDLPPTVRQRLAGFWRTLRRQ